MKNVKTKNKILFIALAIVVAVLVALAIDIAISAQKNVFADEFDTTATTQDEYVEAIFDMCGGDVEAITDAEIRDLVKNAIDQNSAVRAKWMLLSVKKPFVNDDKTVKSTVSTESEKQANSNSASTNDTYQVQIVATDGGVVSGQGSYKKGEIATVKAAPKAGYKFAGWYNGDKLLTTNETFSQIFDKNVQLTASFNDLGDAAIVINNEGHAFGTITVNGKVYDGKTSNPVIQTHIGANIAITAMTPYEGSSDVSFKFWVDGNGKVLSTSLLYGFVVTSSTEIMPVVDRSSQGYATVEFVSAFNQVVGGGQYRATDTIEMPAVPSRLGHETIGWELTADQIKDKIAAGETNIVVFPVYKKLENTVVMEVKYVDTDGKVIAGADPVLVPQESSVAPQALDIPGYTFSCWKDSRGNVLSASKDLYLFLHNNIELTAEYAGPGQKTVEDTAYVTSMDKFKIANPNGKNQIVFKFFRHVPDGYKILDSGVLRCRLPELATEENLIVSNVDGKEVIKFNNFDKDSNNFTMNMISTMKNLDTVMYGRAYAEVQDNDGNYFIVYSDIISASFNSLDF